MVHRILAPILGFLLFPLLPTRADTLTLRNNSELNGRVQYENDSFTISAQFGTGTRTYTFNRKEVRSVELNPLESNSGAPPPQFTNLDAQTTKTKDAMSPSTRRDAANPTQNSSKNKNGTATAKSPLSTDEFDSATNDTVCLRDQTRVVGRVTLIQKGSLLIQIGNKVKPINVRQVAAVLIAPN